MALFTNFDSIQNPTATTTAIIAYAVKRGMSENEITRETNAANPLVWATEACASMGLDGSSSDDIYRTYGCAMVELCETASGIAAIRCAQLDSFDHRRVEGRVNAAVLRLAV